ncbi:MAG: diguanylate cyclase [Colwellia sp.]|nr:diguanylate cyclase [Colwellia sp.]
MRLKLIFLISLLFITAIGNSLFTFQLRTYEEDKLHWVNHTHEVIYHSERLLSGIKDTETGQRGFLLTNEPSYLQPYHAGLISSRVYLQKLKKLTQDNPQQQKLLKLISEVMKIKFAELAKTIELLQNNVDNSVAIAMVKENKGKQYMDNLISLLTNFNNEEKLLLEQRKGDFQASRTRIETLILVQLLFFTFLAVFTLFFLNKNLFQPLKTLIYITKKLEEGRPLSIVDVVQNDEMGSLLSSFYTMSEKVYERTQVLGRKAFYDELTGLKNRSNMNDEIENAINNSKEFNNKLAVFFIDLNDFKDLNDTLGHDAGDIILKEMAVRLKASVRSDDSVFRVGGDEFVVLIKNVKTVAEVQNIASKMLKAAESPVVIQGQHKKFSLSIGVAISPDDSESGVEIVKFSDIAMYAAKRDKDTHYKFFDSSMLKRLYDT